jgi:hypothetical protein
VSAGLLLLLRFILHESWAWAGAVAVMFLLGQLVFWWARRQQSRS